jgi:hypothetical protein
LASAAREAGYDITYSDEDLGRILGPDHFVAIRQTHGGPAPVVAAKALDVARAGVAADAAALQSARTALANADAARRSAVDAL